MARRPVTSAQVANQKWVAAMGQAQAAYTAGVQAVQSSPTAAAATDAAQQKYLSGVQLSVSSGRRAAALNAVSNQQWQQASINKGAPRLASGAQQASPKQLAAAQKLQPTWQGMRDAAAAATGSQGKWLAAMQVLMQHAGKSLS